MHESHDIPPYYMQYLAVRDGGDGGDGGDAKIADRVAEVHGISIQQLKANCLRAADEYRQDNGNLLPFEQAVLDWANS